MDDQSVPALFALLVFFGFAVFSVTAVLERFGYLRNPFEDD